PATALHPIQEENPDAKNDQHRQPEAKRRQNTALLLWFHLNSNPACPEFLDDVGAQWLESCKTLAAIRAPSNAFAINRHFGDLVVLNLRQKFRKRDLCPGGAAATILKDVKQCDNQQDRDCPESEVFGVTH
ncbi:MAG: hypothetical protein P8I56_08650, partial [Paracoccaceae bacterium]|nr:hypothetical protein [Paracoccaceae bacterium]